MAPPPNLLGLGFLLFCLMVSLLYAHHQATAAPDISIPAATASPTRSPDAAATPDLRDSALADTFSQINNAEVTLNFPGEGFTLSPDDEAGEYVSAVMSISLENPGEFIDVGSVWTMTGHTLESVTRAGGVTISLRGSVDGSTWDAWRPYDHFHYSQYDLDDVTGAITADLYGHLISFEPDTRFLQFRIRWDSAALDEPVQILTARFSFISPQPTPDSVQRDISARAASGDSMALPAIAQPVISRTNWGCPQDRKSVV